jgi:two-component sensor histidine kinase
MATRIARGEALQALLINELNHRVKNTLTTVQSLARQSFAEGPASNEARAKFDARLVALGQAHNVLSEEKWESADLRDVVTGAVAPFLPKNGDRLRMDGAPIRITPRCVLVLSMVLHELATNATKYGAWSSPAGTVAIAWVTNDGGDAETLRITWREMDGPPVRVPDRKGFGSRLIEEGLAGLGGSTSVRYLPDGLVCELEIPCD